MVILKSLQSKARNRSNLRFFLKSNRFLLFCIPTCAYFTIMMMGFNLIKVDFMSKHVSELNIELDRDVFLRNLVRELSGTLESVVGLEEASGFVSIVGQHMGDWMNEEYRRAYGCESLNPEQVKDVLIDLKKRIQGDFFIAEMDNDKMVLRNNACPFGDKVVGRPSMCMMTSNVFGTITAENLDYSKVSIEKSFANNDSECKVVVYTRQSSDSESSEGREYYKS